MGKKIIVCLFAAILALLAPCAYSEVFITKDGTGTYVGGLPNLAFEGAYVEWTPSVKPDGTYSDGAPKKEYAYKKFKPKPKFGK